jgi:hypothetical protein
LEAHKILMGLNAQNHDTFKDLVNMLEGSWELYFVTLSLLCFDSSHFCHKFCAHKFRMWYIN